MSKTRQANEASKQGAVTDRASTAKQPRNRRDVNRVSAVNGTAPRPGETPDARDATSENLSVIASAPQPRVLRVVAAAGSRAPFSPDDDVDSLDVYALPNYAINGKTDRAHQVWCGQVVNSPDWLTQIQSIWGGGVYVVRERKANGAFGKSQTVNVSPLPEVEAGTENDELPDDEDFAEDDGLFVDPRLLALERQNHRLQIELARMAEREQLRAESPSKPIPQKSFLEQLRELKEAELLLTPTSANNTNPQQQPRSLADELTELMRGDLIKQIRDLYRNPDRPISNSEDEEKRPSNVWDFLMAAVDSPIAEALTPILNALGQNVIAANAPNVTDQATPAPSVSQPQSPQHLAHAASPEAAYQQLLTQVFAALENDAPIEPVITAIDGFFLQHPQYEQPVINFLSYPPKDLLATVAQLPGASHFSELPHAERWIIRFQQSLFSEDENGAQGGPPNPPTSDGLAPPSGVSESALK